MKETVNQRVKAVLDDSGLNAPEFAMKAGLSAPGVYKILSGESTPSQKTLRAIGKAFGIDQVWLSKGQGAMALPAEDRVESSNPWQDEAYLQVKEENLTLRQQIDKLTQAVLNMSLNKPNFLKALDVAKVPSYLLPGKGTYSGARPQN